jgi:hypothetical protein
MTAPGRRGATGGVGISIFLEILEVFPVRKSFVSQKGLVGVQERSHAQWALIGRHDRQISKNRLTV